MWSFKDYKKIKLNTYQIQSRWQELKSVEHMFYQNKQKLVPASLPASLQTAKT